MVGRASALQKLGKISPVQLNNHAHRLGKRAELVSWGEWYMYKVEKFLKVSKFALFYSLLGILVALSGVLGFTWYWLHFDEEGQPDTDNSFVMSMFIAFQVICSGGINREPNTMGACVAYISMILGGLIVLALLIGMVTEAFETMLHLIRSGDLKAAESDHTLVLGWNESTARLICQLSFCRRQFQQMNESWDRRIFWWRRVAPTTSVAKGAIVIMCDNLTKEEMERKLEEAFNERGIQKHRTRLGYHVICRVGDPSNVQSLRYVGAQRARAIIVNAADGVEFTESEGRLIRTLLSLRVVLYSCDVAPKWDDLRIVVEMPQPSAVVQGARFPAPDKSTLVYLQQVNLFLNHLLFSTLGQPGLADVRMELMCFEGASFKFRTASELHLEGCTVGAASLKWENAVFVGVQRDSEGDDGSGKICSGLLPDADMKIHEKDTVVFFCQFSMPTPRDESAEKRERSSIAAPSAPSRPGANLNGTTATDRATVLRVLICGWRPGWNKPEELLHVLHEIIHGITARLFIQFVCNITEEDFTELMEKAMKTAFKMNQEKDRIKKVEGSKPGEPSWVFNGKCEIAHTYWDEVHFEDLRGVVEKITFHEAVVIPRVPADGRQSELSNRDNWLLSVMLMLKQIQAKLNQKPMHIIAENALDSTSKLTVDPEGDSMTPDFVNMLAIRARALCQVAAYPRMSSVIDDLCSKDKETPCVMLVPSAMFNLDGHHVSFREATERVMQLQPPPRPGAGNGAGSHDVVLGVRTVQGVLTMPPKQSERHFYNDGDSLVIVTRRATSRTEYEEMIKQTCAREPGGARNNRWESKKGPTTRKASKSPRPEPAKIGTE